MDFITETSAYFIKNQCLFGAYPNQDQIQQLEEWGVDLIVNLTSNNEKKIRFYQTSIPTIQFTIPDRKVPENILEFCALVIHIAHQIIDGKKIYIHCKGGHGRSGLVVSAILCYLYKITPKQSFIKTKAYHATRLIHSSKPKKNEFWKNRSPQTMEQRKFVDELFQPYKISECSPFLKRGEWLSGEYDLFLINTNLGSIEGANGEELEMYRNERIRDMVYFQ